MYKFEQIWNNANLNMRLVAETDILFHPLEQVLNMDGSVNI